MSKYYSLFITIALFLSCDNSSITAKSNGAPQESTLAKMGKNEEFIFHSLCENMVEDQLIRRGIKDPQVIQAMRKVPRHHFVPSKYALSSYNDSPLPIGNGQTISQPYIVAYMTEVLKLKKEERVLEIGTGSGYQAAILGELVGQVYSVEIVCSLAQQASEVLKSEGYTNVEVKCADGFLGWPEYAPYDAIIVTAAPEDIPQALKQQLKIGGRMIIPIGRIEFFQELVLVTRTGTDSWHEEMLLPVRFVPMTGGKR